MDVRAQITELVEQKIAGTDIFLVEVKTSPGKIRVSLDHPKGVSIADCVEVSRFLHSTLESTDIFEKHELEVSSAGMEEPLKVMKQYQKRIGQDVSVITLDGQKHNGRLTSASENEVALEEEVTMKQAGKKETEVRKIVIPFNMIKETKVNFSFHKIIGSK